jgi:hypothetical protein
MSTSVFEDYSRNQRIFTIPNPNNEDTRVAIFLQRNQKDFTPGNKEKFH